MGKQHIHAFIRPEGMSVDAVGVLTIHDRDDIAERSASAALSALESAITQWVKQTAEGLAAYQTSSEDYNIGDFVDDYDRKELKPFLKEHGIDSLELQTLCPDQTNTYDRHLVQEDELLD